MSSAYGFFNGVPLASVKHARFITKAGHFYTLARLIFNNTVYETSKTAENGAVVFDGGYANWVFIAPDGRLDYGTMAEMTLGEMLDHLVTTTTASPIPAWDEFAAWLSGSGDRVGQVLAKATRAFVVSVNDPGEENAIECGVPAFQGFTNFPTFLQCIAAATEPAHGESAADYRTAEKAYSFGVMVLGLDDEGVEKEMMTLLFTFRE